MSNKPNCSSCEYLKEQIEEIKKGQIEDCQKHNEENKRRIVGMQGKIMALTIASTVALTIVGQEAVEKIQKLIGSITSVQNIANPDKTSEAESGSSDQTNNTNNPNKIRNPNLKEFVANSNKNIFLEENTKYEGPYRIYVATSSKSNSESSSFVPTRFKLKPKTASKDVVESPAQPEQLPEAVSAIDLAVSDFYATPPVISFDLTSTQLPDIDMTPDYIIEAISVVPAPGCFALLSFSVFLSKRRRI